MDLLGAPGAALVDVGDAYVYVTYAKRLYITLTFACNYMFNTAQVRTFPCFS